jgi:hypothetical protein
MMGWCIGGVEVSIVRLALELGDVLKLGEEAIWSTMTRATREAPTGEHRP